MLGNEAIARGAYEAGVKVGSAYPGTPSTETFEYLVQYKDELYCEWAPNEKAALEMALGAAFTGARAIAVMKHVGLNVAADPLMTASYTGITGGLVIVVADDPGMHSSQNEQDTRHYARLAKVPLLEPANPSEAREMTKEAFVISEKFRTPVILRSTTRVSHSKGVVEQGPRRESPLPIQFQKDPSNFVAIPLYARSMHKKVEKRFAELQAFTSESPLNKMELFSDTELGIVTNSVAYEYVKVAFPETSVLKLSLSYPFPDTLLKDFCNRFKTILVVEELDPILEEHIRSLGFNNVHGKDLLPICDEYNPTLLYKARYQLQKKNYTMPAPRDFSLPARPPVLCPGCPHRSVFFELNKHDIVITGDIGCYSLAVLPPLKSMDTIVCMGGGFTLAHGMERAGNQKKVVGVMGDSTFFHSGLNGLLDIAYNKGLSTLIVLDNRITAMTGRQHHPGTGQTLMGEKTRDLSITDLAHSCGFDFAKEVDPLDFKALHTTIKAALDYDGPSLVVTKKPCALLFPHDYSRYYTIRQDTCKKCGICLKFGCPAIEKKEEADGSFIIEINSFLCNSCALCKNQCPFEAIEFYQET